MTSPTPPDIAAAAERLHAEIMNLPCKPPIFACDDNFETGHKVARHAAAELVLSLTATPEPARLDDGELVTKEWLQSVGFTETETHNLRLEFSKHYGEDTATFHLQATDPDGLPDCIWEIWVQSIELEREGAMLPCEPQTRGQVRDLCRVLGVPLAAPGYQRPCPVDDVHHEPKAKQ